MSDKLERLLNLTAALLETPRPLTAGEIREKVPGYPESQASFRRTFERDKADLREMGIPVVIDEIVKGDVPEQGYRIPKDQYYLRDPGLEADELAALQLAASAVRLDGLAGAAALWKLGGVPASARQERRDPAVAALPADERLVQLFAAVTERCQVTFSYRSTTRTVDPYRLDFSRGRWYVGGFDHLRGEERVFRLDRVEGAIALGAPKSFQRPATDVPGARLEPWQLGEGEAIRALVLVDAAQAPVAVAAVGDASVLDRREDGSVVIELPVTNTDGFRSFVLGFLEHAEVLEPAELRDDVIRWLEAMCRA